MTISTTTAEKQYDGNGSTTAFPSVFVFNDSNDIEVYLKVDSTGVETLQTLTTHYTVAGGGGTDTPATGTVTMVTAPATGETLTLKRVVANAQPEDLPTSGPMPVAQVEKQLDRTVLMIQQITAQLLRTLRAPVSDDADTIAFEMPGEADRVSKFLAFDASGNPIASTGPTGDSTIPVTAFVETLLDDANATAFLATLGVVLGTTADDVVQLDSNARLPAVSARNLTEQQEAIILAVTDETSALSTGTAKMTFRMPFAMTLTDIRASVNTAPTGSTIIVDVNDSGTSIMTTNKLEIDVSEETTETAATAPALTDTALVDDAEITIDIDQVGSGTAGAGLKVTLIGYRT